MKAYVLVETAAGKTARIKAALAKLKRDNVHPCAMQTLDVVTGPYDFILVLQGDALHEIGDFVTAHVGPIDGVTRTTTLIAVNNEERIL